MTNQKQHEIGEAMNKNKRTKKAILSSLTPGIALWVRNVDGLNATAWRKRKIVKVSSTQLVAESDEGKKYYNTWSRLSDNGQNDGGFFDHDPNVSQFLEYALKEPTSLAAVGAPMRWGQQLETPNPKRGKSQLFA